MSFRFSPRVDPFFSSNFISKILLRAGIRQDDYIKDDAVIHSILINNEKCNNCGICTKYCPMNLQVPSEVDSDKCIACLYCFFVCPSEAVEIQGALNFLSSQIDNYGEIIRQMIVDIFPKEGPYNAWI